jgi:hypothetical protein
MKCQLTQLMDMTASTGDVKLLLKMEMTCQLTQLMDMTASTGDVKLLLKKKSDQQQWSLNKKNQQHQCFQ